MESQERERGMGRGAGIGLEGEAAGGKISHKPDSL